MFSMKNVLWLVLLAVLSVSCASTSVTHEGKLMPNDDRQNGYLNQKANRS